MNHDPILAMTRLGDHWVPGVWRFFLPDDVFYFRVDAERGASCFDCPQVREAGFHPTIRCCSHIPRISNFMLGFALTSAATAERVRRHIEKGFATPEGTQLSPLQLERSLLDIAARPDDQNRVVCPFLETESRACAIYAFRNATCSSFFCRHDRGAAGAVFWDDLQSLVGQIESALAQWSLTAIGFDLDAYFQRFESLAEGFTSCSNGDGSWSEATRRLLFGDWYGRECKLFEGCASLISDHRRDLFRIASEQRLLQTRRYDAALRASLEERFHAQLVAEALPCGDAETIANLWYGVRLSQRNLQLAPLARS